MSWLSFLAIAVGASLGAWCRWGLGAWLNPLMPSLPLGTLAANLSGGLLIGVLLEGFSRGGVPAEVRLMLITGFMGALTTFSTFSAEIVSAVRRSEYLWALAGVGAHVLGSLVMTGLGMALAFWVMSGRT